MQRIRDVIAAVVADKAALQELQRDPAGLARLLNLSADNVAALQSADRFFETEKPITDQYGAVPDARPAPPAAQPGRARPVTAAAFAPAPSRITGITVSADSGTLLTGPTTGTYTIVSSASATSTPVTGSPGHRPPAPGVPRGPGSPVAPVTPFAPVIPSGPTRPAQPGVTHSPWVPPGEPCLPEVAPVLQADCGGHSACEAAIVAVVANVSVTANVAIAAITAIAQQQKRAENSVRNEVAPQ